MYIYIYRGRVTWLAVLLYLIRISKCIEEQ